jgi:protein TonB
MPGGLKRLLYRLAVLAVVAGLVLFVRDLLQGGGKNAEPFVQRVRLIEPPPPPLPPPPKVVEEPPEIETKEKIEIKDDEASAQEQPVSDDRLGLDADGSGSDAFGLAAKKGGKDLLASVQIGGDKRSSDAQRFAYYDSQIERFLERLFSQDDELRRASYTATFQLWIDPGGRVQRLDLSRSTGNPTLDARLKQTLMDAGDTGLLPPVDLPQPIRIRLISRAASG